MANHPHTVGVLFVCMGNICRSPTAEGIFRHHAGRRGHAARLRIDSAGTIAYHAGEPPDARSQSMAQARGIDISGQRARQVRKSDFDDFDYILAMDSENLRDLLTICPPIRKDRVRLLCDFNPDPAIREVPDPYYGGPGGFERVFDIIDAAALRLLDHIELEHFRR